MGELIFYSKIKSFQCFQCLAAVLSHVESLENFKNKYKIKKEKVRNQTIHNKVQQKQNMRRRRIDPTEKKKKKKKMIGRRIDQQRRRRKKGSAKKKKKRKRGRRTDRQRRRRKKGKKKKKQLLHGATLLRHRLLPFLLLLCFLSLQMMYRPNIHLPTETVGFRRYGWYFFRYEIRGLSVPMH